MSAETASIAMEPAIVRMLAFHARLESPREAVGLLWGAAGEVQRIEPLPNRLHVPGRFASVLRHCGGESGGLRTLGLYHSHPSGPLTPSAADFDGFDSRLGLLLIVSPRSAFPPCRAFRRAGGGWLEVPMELRNKRTPFGVLSRQ